MFGRLTFKQQNKNSTGTPVQEKRPIMKMPSQQEVWHPNNKSQIQQEDSRHKEDSLRKCLPNRKADTQIAIHKPNWKTCLPNRKTDTQTANQHQKRKTCPRKKTRWENAFPTGRRTPKQETSNPTERLAPKRRLIKKMSSQQEEQHPNRKSRTQQKDLPRKEDSLRKCFSNRKTDTQTANQQPNSNPCPRTETSYENAFPTDTQTANHKYNRKTRARKKTH